MSLGTKRGEEDVSADPIDVEEQGKRGTGPELAGLSGQPPRPVRKPKAKTPSRTPLPDEPVAAPPPVTAAPEVTQQRPPSVAALQPFPASGALEKVHEQMNTLHTKLAHLGESSARSPRLQYPGMICIGSSVFLS